MMMVVADDLFPVVQPAHKPQILWPLSIGRERYRILFFPFLYSSCSRALALEAPLKAPPPSALQLSSATLYIHLLLFIIFVPGMLTGAGEGGEGIAEDMSFH